MPILPVEPCMYPEDLLRTDEPGEVEADSERRWWCLHTKPRQEKAAARYLLNRRIEHYLPQGLREGRTPGGRRVRSMVPLFDGYVFLRGDEHERVEALQGGQLVRVLEVADQRGLIADLRQIHQLISSGLPIASEPTHPVGSRVRIRDGPLAGLVGMVVRRARRDQFVAIVRFLNRGVSVDLEDWQVERCGG